MGGEGKAEPGMAPHGAILLSAVLWGTLWIPLREINESGGSGAGGEPVRGWKGGLGGTRAVPAMPVGCWDDDDASR